MDRACAFKKRSPEAERMLHMKEALSVAQNPTPWQTLG